MIEWLVIVIIAGAWPAARGLSRATRALRRHVDSRSRRERMIAARRLGAGADALREGEHVTLTGTVQRIGELLEAPLSGRPCVCYLALVDVFSVDGSREAREAAMTPFLLETTHGRVVVDGGQATLEVPAAPVEPRRIEREVAFLQRQLSTSERSQWRNLREISICEGDRVAVGGVVALAPDIAAQHGYRDQPTTARIVAPLAIGRPR